MGSPAPDFVTRNTHGENVTLSELRGAPVLLVFYPFAFTGTCTGELRAVQEHLTELRALGTRVLALSTDTMFALRVFAEAEGFEFDLLTDHWPHGAIATAYGVFDEQLGCAMRGSFVLDAAGVVTWKTVNHIGEARDIAEHVAALQAHVS
ncbi:MAG: peroxiredoxin [Propionibacteriaceae bacterium]